MFVTFEPLILSAYTEADAAKRAVRAESLNCIVDQVDKVKILKKKKRRSSRDVKNACSVKSWGFKSHLYIHSSLCTIDWNLSLYFLGLPYS